MTSTPLANTISSGSQTLLHNARTDPLLLTKLWNMFVKTNNYIVYFAAQHDQGPWRIEIVSLEMHAHLGHLIAPPSWRTTLRSSLPRWQTWRLQLQLPCQKRRACSYGWVPLVKPGIAKAPTVHQARSPSTSSYSLITRRWQIQDTDSFNK